MTIEVCKTIVEILMPLFADLLTLPLVGPEKLMMREFLAIPDNFFLAETNQLFPEVNNFLISVLPYKLRFLSPYAPTDF